MDLGPCVVVVLLVRKINGHLLLVSFTQLLRLYHVSVLLPFLFLASPAFLLLDLLDVLAIRISIDPLLLILHIRILKRTLSIYRGHILEEVIILHNMRLLTLVHLSLL